MANTTRRIRNNIFYFIFEKRYTNIVPPVKQLLPHWSKFSLHPALYRQIHAQRFKSPTPIQSQALHHALQGRGLIGIAETGSGKPLGSGLPILNRILASPLPATTIKPSLKALVLSPTRELALQVSSHLQACVPSRSEEEMTKHVPPRVSIVPIVGGMSAHKQERLLFRGVDIIVATPGRLWDLLSEVCGSQREDGRCKLSTAC